VLIALHKPFGVLCQFSPTTDGSPTLADYVSTPNIYPAGRLDKNSEGLLLLTDNGPLQHQISHPRTKTPKEYWVQLEHAPGPEFAQVLRTGTALKDGHAEAQTASPLAQDTPTLLSLGPHPGQLPDHRAQNSSWYALTLTSGKNRVVRRLCAALGHPVLRLIRVQIGNIQLDRLAAGESREVQWP